MAMVMLRCRCQDSKNGFKMSRMVSIKIPFGCCFLIIELNKNFFMHRLQKTSSIKTKAWITGPKLQYELKKKTRRNKVSALACFIIRKSSSTQQTNSSTEMKDELHGVVFQFFENFKEFLRAPVSDIYCSPCISKKGARTSTVVLVKRFSFKEKLKNRRTRCANFCIPTKKLKGYSEKPCSTKNCSGTVNTLQQQRGSVTDKESCRHVAKTRNPQKRRTNLAIYCFSIYCFS